MSFLDYEKRHDLIEKIASSLERVSSRKAYRLAEAIGLRLLGYTEKYRGYSLWTQNKERLFELTTVPIGIISGIQYVKFRFVVREKE